MKLRFVCVLFLAACAGRTPLGTAKDPTPQLVTHIGQPTVALTVVGSRVYFATTSGDLYRAPVTGGAATRITAAGPARGSLVHDARHVFFVPPVFTQTRTIYPALGVVDVETDELSRLPFPDVGFTASFFALAATPEGRIAWLLSNGTTTAVGVYEDQQFDAVAEIPAPCSEIVRGPTSAYVLCNQKAFAVGRLGRTVNALDGVSPTHLVGVDVDGLVFLEGSTLYGYLSRTQRYLYGTDLVDVTACDGCQPARFVEGETAFLSESTRLTAFDLAGGPTTHRDVVAPLRQIASDGSFLYWTVTGALGSTDVYRAWK